ncbi:MAG: general secretion pathway protein GspB [Proteobacteria bacterium]|nr:general secretion pathway protein GspB [Pseudomonadota bacterium]
MSYILDALKKSEQERGHGNIPDVQTVHSSSLNYRSEKKAYWPYFLIVAVLLNLLAIVYFIFNRENPPQIEAETALSTETADAVNTTSITADATVAPEISAAAIIEDNKNAASEEVIVQPATPSVDKKTQIPIKKTEVENTDTGSQTSSGLTDVIEFHELPESIKQELPAIIVSAHIYSTNPAQRSIVINNNFMEEGDYVLDGLILYEITPNGAIFAYQGTLFNYGVVSGWQ